MIVNSEKGSSKAEGNKSKYDYKKKESFEEGGDDKDDDDCDDKDFGDKWK